MTKKEMARAIAEEFDITVVVASKIVQQVFDQIVQTLETKKRIELRDFGVFEVRKKCQRIGRNPRTGDEVAVPERLIAAFKPGKEMEERIRKMAEVTGRV